MRTNARQRSFKQLKRVLRSFNRKIIFTVRLSAAFFMISLITIGFLSKTSLSRFTQVKRNLIATWS
jgi:hypothetical protein